jgi:hypothetical protein
VFLDLFPIHSEALNVAYLFCILSGELEGDLQAGQIKKRLDSHIVGSSQKIKEHFTVQVIIRNKVLVPLLVHNLSHEENEKELEGFVRGPRDSL